MGIKTHHVVLIALAAVLGLTAPAFGSAEFGVGLIAPARCWADSG